MVQVPIIVEKFDISKFLTLIQVILLNHRRGYLYDRLGNVPILRSELMKLCYFCDCNHFVRTGHTISGCIYVHTRDGPSPIFFDIAIKELLTDDLILCNGRGFACNPLPCDTLSKLPCRDTEPTLEDDEYCSVLETLERLGDKDLKEYTKTDIAFRVAKEGQIINLNLANYGNALDVME